jgi:preprotein translocase subunit SecB
MDTANNTQQAEFQIQKLYLKDLSFEIPKGTETFKSEWKPELKIDLNYSHKELSEKNMFEVTLIVKCNVKCDGDITFTTEVHQAGIFLIANLEENQLQHALGAYCPNILYPYAREAISDVVSKGGFPQLCLAPVNFELLYQQKSESNAAAV